MSSAGSWKFVDFLTEGEEAYRQGGLHPVRLGDDLKDGQYKLLRKLGYGASATVWLARDFLNKTYVAVKILAAKHTEPIHELQMLRYTNETAPDQASKFITQLLDSFEHAGPNGVHKCLVFEPMGATVNTMVENLPEFEARTMFVQVRYPVWMAKSILKQSLQALAFLHGIGLSHGDVQPGNMLFALTSKAGLDATPEDELRQPEDVEAKSITKPRQTEGGDLDASLPLYLCASQSLAAFANISPGFQIKLSDMGASYVTEHPPAEIETPLALRAPEHVLLGEVNKTHDIWSFGCLVFELITGQRLFNIVWIPTGSYEDDQHLLEMSDTLGALPEELYRHWKTSSWYFTPTREQYNCRPGGVPEGGEPIPPLNQTMEGAFDEAAPEMDAAEALQVKALVRRILQYDPAQRPSAVALLDDPWFRDIDVGF